MHPLARTTPVVRAEIVSAVENGAGVSEIAQRFHVSRQTVYKWLARYRAGGESALADRAPIASSHPTRISPKIERMIGRLRRNRRLLGWQIASILGLARSTVIKILKRLKLARLKDLDPPRITQRYAYAKPGQLVHIDIKKLARFERIGHRFTGDRTKRSRRVGFDVIYVAVDDATRRSISRRYAAENADTAAHFLAHVVGEFRRRRSPIERIMTDNGKVFGAHIFADILAQNKIKHIFTPPFTPQWNGKAERFIQTMLREWAYAVAYRNSDERLAALPAWLRYYNQERQHVALNYLSPAAYWARLRKQCP